MSEMRIDRKRLRDASEREPIVSLLEDVLRALHPGVLLPRLVRRTGDGLRVGAAEHDLAGRRVLALGAGKASAGMARALEKVLGDRLSGGVVVTRYGHAVPTERIRLLEGGHPIPDERGLAASREVLALAQGARPEDLVIGLFSGGGSALLSLPPPGISLADLAEATRLLLLSGAPIGEVNTLRRHLSVLQGGGLVRALGGAAVSSLLLSDVIGDPIESIASGPTAPDPTTFADAREVLVRRDLWEVFPAAVRRHVERGLSGEIAETPKPGDPLFSRVDNLILAGLARSAEIAQREGERNGFTVGALPFSVEGEARRVGAALASLGRALARRGKRAFLVGSGETTVHVRGRGHGGRNQEVALAAAVDIEGTDGVVVVSLATDGSDGPTDAAGAIADGRTTLEARRLGLSPERALDENDAYPLLGAAGDLLFTGPTGTNVADLVLVAFEPGGSRGYG